MEMAQSVSSVRSTVCDVGVLTRAWLESTLHAEGKSVQGSTSEFKLHKNTALKVTGAPSAHGSTFGVQGCKVRRSSLRTSCRNRGTEQILGRAFRQALYGLESSKAT